MVFLGGFFFERPFGIRHVPLKKPSHKWGVLGGFK
jgi:hypothetical protein